MSVSLHEIGIGSHFDSESVCFDATLAENGNDDVSVRWNGCVNGLFSPLDAEERQNVQYLLAGGQHEHSKPMHVHHHSVQVPSGPDQTCLSNDVTSQFYPVQKSIRLSLSFSRSLSLSLRRPPLRLRSERRSLSLSFLSLLDDLLSLPFISSSILPLGSPSTSMKTESTANAARLQ